MVLNLDKELVSIIIKFKIMKGVVFFYALFINAIVILSQGGIGPSNVVIPNGQPQSGVIDGVYEKKDVLAKKRVIPFEHVRESDYIWGKRTWSYIDLREKINHPLYYPHEDIDVSSGNVISMPQGRYSLYYILAMALKKGQIMAYKDATVATIQNNNVQRGGDDFSLPVPRNYSVNAGADVTFQSAISDGLIGTSVVDPIDKAKTVGVDTVFYLQSSSVLNLVLPKVYLATDVIGPYTLDISDETTSKALAKIDPTTGLPAPVWYTTKKQMLYKSEQIIKYKLKEDWFFDKERSVLDVRTIGMAPVIQSDSGEIILFWVYFPQVRDVLKNYYVYDAKSTVGGNTFDHLFMTRRFNAVVYKESSLYDRKIEDYRFGADALYESEKVKNTIRTFEHDVWNF
jgi:gliding motility associated protien GldN